MSAIPGYPRQVPPKYEKWLPKFTGTDAISVEEHMSKFWAFFHLLPVSDDAEDLVRICVAYLVEGCHELVAERVGPY